MAGRVSSIRGSLSSTQAQFKKQKKAQNPLSAKTVKLALENLEKQRYQGVTSLPDLIQAIKKDDVKRSKEILYKALKQSDDVELLAFQAYEQLRRVPEAEDAVTRFKCSFCQTVVQEAVLRRDLRVLDKALAISFGIEEEPKECILQALGELRTKEPQHSQFIERLSAEIQAISDVPLKRHNLEPYDMLAISLFAETKLEALKDKTSAVYLRGIDTGLSRSIVLDPKRHTYTILSKKHGTLRAEGTFKRVTDAVEVAPYKERAVARRIIRMVTKADHDISDREIDFEERYGNILSWTRYQSKNRPYETKTMILQEAFDNDLYLYTKYTSGNQRKKLEFNELLEVLLQAASTLHEMHEDGLAHRDVKIKNVLYRKTSDGKVEAKLIDFGHSYRIDEGKYPKKRAKGYGTLRYTSPDALEFPKNTSNPRLLAQAEDMYALGCLIYEVYFQKVLPWGSDTYKACKDKENGQQHRQKAIKLQKKEAKRLLEKSQEKPGKPESELMWICARLLEPDPKLRMRMPEFLVALKELKNP